MATSTKRITLLDEIRGFAVFCMIFFHGFYTMYMFFGFDIGLKFVNFFSPAEPYFASLFIFISGICSTFSSSNLKRGLKLLGVALGVTAVSMIFFFEQAIWFGILHFLAVSILIYSFLNKLIRTINPYLGIFISSLFYIFTMNIKNGFLGLSAYPIIIPYTLTNIKPMLIFGITNNNFVSMDYFPLFPWFFVFLSGTFFANIINHMRLPDFCYKNHIKMFSFLGRNALIVYILHQPVIYSILWLISLILY